MYQQIVITRGYMTAHPTNKNIAIVRIKEMKLIMTPYLLFFKRIIPAAQPPIYVRMNVPLGIWISVESETSCVLNTTSRIAKHTERNRRPPKGVWYFSDLRASRCGANPLVASEQARREAAPM
jgi:hypothetical protein